MLGIQAKTRLPWSPMTWVGIVIGFTPLLAGLVFRTYGYHVAPAKAEILRQLDVPFILVEVAVVMWARGNGLNYRALFMRFDRPAQIALLVFLGSFWVSSAFISADPAYSLIRASFWLVHIAFGFAVFHLAGIPTRDELLRFGGGLFLGLVAFLPLTAVHLLNAPDPASIPEGRIIWSSAIPGCLSVRHLGIWAALVLAAAVGGLYASGRHRGAEIVFGFLIFLAMAVLLWSGTRSGVFGIGAACAACLVTRREIPPVRLIIIASGATLAAVFASQAWLPPDPSFGIIQRSTQAGGEFTSGRTEMWIKMLHVFAGSPVFGVGEGAVQWLATVGSDRHVQPHNSVIQMLSSWGLIACLASGYLVLRLLLIVHGMARRDVAIVPIVLVIDCLLVMSLADGVLYFSRFIMWFAGFAGLSLAIAARHAEEKQARAPLLARPSTT